MRSEREKQLHERIDLIKLNKGTICHDRNVTIQWNLDKTNFYLTKFVGVTNDILCPAKIKSKNNLEDSL